MMLFLMLTVLMIQLQSFSRLFLVISVVPLGLIGVVAALLLSDKPLGFVAILGVLALAGMIARNSVVLIDQIETEKANGRHPWDAVVEASTHRFRPILLTAAAAILGMIPIAPTIFWGPMAYAIMGGLAVATLLTLVFLPALYVTWFRIKVPDADMDADDGDAHSEAGAGQPPVDDGQRTPVMTRLSDWLLALVGRARVAIIGTSVWRLRAPNTAEPGPPTQARSENR
jgi:predicted RND superfamily exporter protein